MAVGVALGLTATAALATAVIAFAAAAFVMALWTRGNDLVAAWGDWPWYRKVAGVFSVIVAAAGDVVGVTGVLEGIFEQDAVTGRQLSEEEATDRFWLGALSLVTAGLIHFFVRGSGRGAAADRPGVAEGEARPPRWLDEQMRRDDLRKPMPDEGRPGEPLRREDAVREEPAAESPRAQQTGDAERVAIEREAGVADAEQQPNARQHAESSPEAYEALAKKHGVTPDELAALREQGVDAAAADGLLSRGVSATEIWGMAHYYGPDSVLAVEMLARGGLEPRLGMESVRIGDKTGTLADVIDLGKSGRLDNPGGFRKFLKEMQTEIDTRGLFGTRDELADAANRARSGHRVSLGGRKKSAGDPESGQADIVDYTERAAVQRKRVVAPGEKAVVDRTYEAVQQLRGEGGEIPPDGYARIARTFIGEANELFMADRGQLAASLRGKLGLEPTDADIVLIFENGHPLSPFEFSAGELL